MDSPRWSPFDIKVVTYKTVYKHEIKTYILVPKNIAPGPHPILVKIHGGGAVTGSAIYPDWFPQFIITLAVQKSAILVLPNYRLLPESTPLEMVSDINDFWTWLRTPAFSSALPSNITPDHDHTLLYGDSAGGYLSVLSLCTLPENTIKACIAAYPQIDLEDPHYTTAFEKHPFGVPQLPTSILDDHLAAMDPDPEKRELVSDVAKPYDRINLILVVMQQGRYLEFFPKEQDALFPLRAFDRVVKEKKEGKRSKMPYFWLFHGDKDDVLPFEGSVKFAKMWREEFGEEGIKLHIEPGGEHGFDAKIDVDVPWVKEGLKETVKAWLE